jgi:atypical dual specificity phosphatase
MVLPVQRNSEITSETKFYKSPLFQVSVITAILLATLPFRWSIGLITLSLTGMVKFPHYLPKSLLYEVAIADLIVRSWLSKLIPWMNQEWWHEIVPGLVLGGIPLKNYNHLQLLKERGIGAVCAILEDSEACSETLYSTPVLEKHWEEEGIVYLRLSCEDMKAMSLKDLKKLVEWIRLQILMGRKVYLHCKAGRGRSAMVAAAYLMQYYTMTLKDAMQSLLAKRSVVLFRPCQFTRLQEFESEVILPLA